MIHQPRGNPRQTTMATVYLLAVLVTLFLTTVANVGAQSSDTPIYTIVSPAKIRPNSDYHLSFQLYNTTEPVNINVSISGPSTDGPFNQVTKSVLVNPAETRILNLEIGEWSKGNYKLFVEGSVGGQPIFANNTALQFEPKSYSIFVQTDKSVYKPGQTVRFRAIIVNPSLIPNVVGTLDIYIKDSKDNLIKQWKRIFPQRGVVSEQFVLSEQPPLGDWTIMVDVVGQKASKVFSVAEYVLPTFSVEVRLPPYATYNRSDVVATVKATYTYGKPVKGEVTLTVQPRIRHSSFSFRPLEQYQTKMKIYDEGSVDIPVNIVRDLNLKTDFFEREIEFFALVEEGLTGRKYNKSAVMKIYHKEVKVELIKTSKTFKPGLKYTAYLKVAYQDDSPVDDNGPPLTLKYGYSYNDDAWNNTIVEVPVKGLIRIDLFPPRSTADSKVFIIGWRAEYRGQTYFLEGVDCAQSPSNNFLQVISKNVPGESTNNGLDPNVATVGGEVSFEINCTEPIKHIVYEVMGKGDIVLARNVRSTLLEGGTSFEITIPVTHKMAPKARLLVYYVREENQELVADALNFKVDGVFKTPVSLSSDVTQTKPGSLVSLQIHTKPNAYVGLLGVDQSVLLLKSGNDITQQDVLDELESYDSGKRSDSGYSPGGGNWLYRPMFWSGSSTAGEIFDDSGVVILTNGLVHRQIQAMYIMRLDSPGISPIARPMLSSALDSNAVPEQSMRAVPFAAGGYSKKIPAMSAPKKKIIKLRKDFPETWIWTNLTSDLDGAATYQDSIPDTITSWYVSAFAVDSITGLGVAPDSLKISVFRPFFVKLSLPYSLIRGESVALQAIIFNYQKKPIQAEVTMFNPKDDFEFTNAANEIEFAGKTEIREKRKTVTIPPYDGVSVSFLITPKKLGYIDLRVEAKSDNAGDAVIRKLLVKPEGQTQYFNKAFFIKSDLPDSVQSRNISVDIASNAVPGSVRVTVSGISDILGPTVNNIDDLLRMPYGCGEQNMINLVPNIVVLNYLTRVNRLSQAIKAKAVGHIETGYQRELTYRRDDGSFSAFGASDKAGSTWLTAFVAKSFIQARPYIDIDPAIVTRSIEWLLTRQKKDGSFAEYGEVHNKALQGGSALKLGSSNETSSPSSALTSYVLIAILHESKMSPDSIRTKNQQAISRAEDFIYSQIAGSTNPYEVAIGAYALHLANSDRKEFAYKRMMSLVKRDSDGLMYWTLQKDDQDNKTTSTSSSERLRKVSFGSAYLLYPNALDVETSSYALLTLVLRSDIDNSIPVLRWLISKQNSNGGFSSTQDTVVGLQSLGAIAQRISTATVKMAVEIKHGNSLPTKRSPEFSLDSQTLHFNTDNSLVLQQIQLDPETEWVNLEASGFGTAIVQVSYQYNLAVSAEKPAFFLNPQKDKTSTENYLQLSVCTYYKDGNSTNMAVMEVELPSGYSADVEALPAATRAKEVKRVDTANNDGTVFIYLDRVTRDELCITVPAHRTHRVANNKPVPVTIYDYYDRSKLSRIFYEPTLVTVNDILSDDQSSTTSTTTEASSVP